MSRHQIVSIEQMRRICSSGYVSIESERIVFLSVGNKVMITAHTNQSSPKIPQLVMDGILEASSSTTTLLRGLTAFLFPACSDCISAIVLVPSSEFS
mmetsp:Transcript_4204/g.9328  ORF Transcript_4204/g.9328 Transcript_4204/m.9328 type:complete len:97 (+) Transcript_4204:304-594(+)